MDANYAAQQARQETLATLIALCQQEDTVFRQQKPVEPVHCYEIWRRAFTTRDEQACEAVVTLYSRYVQRWLSGYLGKAAAPNLEEDFLTNGAFIRLFRYIPPERFAEFPYLSQLMKYLKSCCQGVVLDYLRHFERDSYLSLPDDDDDANRDLSQAAQQQIPTDATTIARLDFQKFWEIIKLRLNEREQLALYARFVEDIPPREIVQSYPAFFADTEAVHQVIKSAVRKLRNDPQLENWLKNQKS